MGGCFERQVGITTGPEATFSHFFLDESGVRRTAKVASKPFFRKTMGGVTVFLAIFIYSKWMRVGDYCSDDLQKK